MNNMFPRYGKYPLKIDIFLMIAITKVSSFSWVQNTYYLPSNQAIPETEEERESNEIKYYQWVTFVLLFQAFMFYLPRIFWTTFSLRSGLHIGDLVSPTKDLTHQFYFNYISFIDTSR